MNRPTYRTTDTSFGCLGCLVIWAIYLGIAGVTIAFFVWVIVTVLNFLNVL